MHQALGKVSKDDSESLSMKMAAPSHDCERHWKWTERQQQIAHDTLTFTVWTGPVMHECNPRARQVMLNAKNTEGGDKTYSLHQWITYHVGEMFQRLRQSLQQA